MPQGEINNLETLKQWLMLTTIMPYSPVTNDCVEVTCN